MKKYDGYALITGGDKGIGLAIAEQLAQNGYDLFLVARHADELKDAKTSLTKKYKVDVLTLVQDLTEPKAAENLFSFAQKKGIHVALLINNAGFGHWAFLEEANHELEINMVDLMCRAVTDLTYLFLPDMIKKGEGGIIMMSSFVAPVHMPKFAVYAACKAFESSFGITMNYELQSKNIDVLVVCPAVIRTDFHSTAGTKADVEKGESNLLGFKYHSADEVAEKALNSLGKKIRVVVGNLMDKMFFYSSALMPPKLERFVLKNYYKYVYKTHY